MKTTNYIVYITTARDHVIVREYTAANFAAGIRKTVAAGYSIDSVHPVARTVSID